MLNEYQINIYTLRIRKRTTMLGLLREQRETSRKRERERENKSSGIILNKLNITKI